MAEQEGKASCTDQIYCGSNDFLVFAAGGQSCALPSQSVVSVIDTPKATPIPYMPRTARGIIEYMGESIPLYDTRRCFGKPTLREETDDLLKLLEARKQDHLKWLAGLSQSVQSGSPISVQLDPHQCAFGKWYDTFKPRSLTLAAYLKRFDEPHKRLHGVAVKASELIQRGAIEEAKTLVEVAERGTLAQLVRLFEGIHSVVNSTLCEYAVIMRVAGEQKAALTADFIDFFGKLDKVVYPLPRLLASRETSFVDAIGVREGESSREEVLIINGVRLQGLKAS